MPEVKIGVGANAGGVDQAIQKITASMNKLGSAVAANQKLKFEPTDVKNMARDLDLINKQFKQTLALSAQVRNALKNSGQSDLHISQIDWSKTSTDPRAAQRMRDRAFMHTVRGTSLDPTLSNDVDGDGNIVPPAPPAKPPASGGSGGSGGGSGGRRPPAGEDEGSRGGGFGRGARRYGRGMAGRTAGAFSGGVGGPVGGMLQEGIQGAGTGMEVGGLLGGLGGAAAGLVGGGLIAAAAMAGKAVSEGIDQAKDRNLDLDLLKRSLGDLGVSFKGLSDASWVAARDLGMANGEFVKMEQLANSASGGAYRTPDELAGATRSGVDIARAYGLQPGQGVAFTAGMQRMDAHQNNKELAATLAEAIVNTQGKATPSEVMQAMQGFAAQQNRFNSGVVDLNRFGNAYSSMLGVDGMTADHASSILGQANASMQQMGGSEASRNFTMQAFGSLDPIRAAMRAEGGLFSNGLDNRDINGYMSQHGSKDWETQNKGPEGTNFSVIRGAFDNAYAGRGRYGAEMELDAEKNYFGLKSYADTASFMNMSDSDHSGISMLLKNAGIDLKDVREGGIQALAGISKTTDFQGVDDLYRKGPDAIRNRKDMSESDLSSLDRAEKSGDFEKFRSELVRVMAGKGQEDDAGSTQRTIDANISDMKTMVGEKLIPYTQAMMEGILAMANKIPGVNIADPSLIGPPKSAMGESLPAGSTVVRDMGSAGKITRGGDGLHTATGGTWWDKAVDATAGGLNWLKGQGQDGSGDPLGIRSNNPLNMLHKGQEDVYSDPTVGIAKATSNLESGYRGLTLAQIQDKWTGGARTGNTPEMIANYTKLMTGATGLKAGDVPNLDDPKVVAALMKGMIRAENGKMPYSDDQVNAGVGAGMGRLSTKGFHPDMSIAEEPTSKQPKPAPDDMTIVSEPAEKQPKPAPDDMTIVAETAEKKPKPAPDDMTIVAEPAAKIPAKDRSTSAADASAAASASKVGSAAGSGAPYGFGGGDINITLQQSVTTPGGATKTKTLSTKVSKPSASGTQTPTIIQIPA